VTITIKETRIVDSIVARRKICESNHKTAAFFVDGRMSPEVLRVIAIDELTGPRFLVQVL
jgi:hypothetical protein